MNEKRNPPAWAMEFARRIIDTEFDTPELDLMARPFSLDSDGARDVLWALEILHARRDDYQ